jgi:signal transduction histidine kinase
VALAALVNDVAEVMDLGPDTDPALDNQVSAELRVLADPDQMFRVLSNLIRNASQALRGTDRPAGSNLITVTAEPKGERVVIRIADNGPGVPERARQHLFEAFKGSATAGGSGLGLAIAAELVNLHGGRIELEESAQGAVFRIEL